MRKIKLKPANLKLPRSDSILLVQDAAQYYLFCNDRWEQAQQAERDRQRADFAQRFFSNLRRIFHETD